MRKMIYTFVLAVTASAASAGTLDQDPGYATYRRVVYGDPNVQVAPASEQPAQPQPGAYARYLMNLGWPREAALAQALRAGEHATLVARDAPPAASDLTPYELYQRSALGWPIETLRPNRRQPATLAAHSE
ncbi:MAG TPA: hypothetical protein VLW55_23765 [Burkholderiaceae bacterium]|nr:hypothetical protein [Burkholderiaceae bacterium]